MENEDKNKIKPRKRLGGRRYFTQYMHSSSPKTKALLGLIIDGDIDLISLHSEQIRELQRRFEPNTNRLIDKRDGIYYYGGEALKGVNEKTQYWVIFDTIFTLMPDGGFRTYTVIEKELRKRRVGGRKLSPLKGTKMIERIRHNLTSDKNGFFRYAKIPNSADEGRAIIETKKGDGIIFNNRL